MQALYARCCGLDVHKDGITACMLAIDEQGQRPVRKQVFRSYWKDLQRRKLWLYEATRSGVKKAIIGDRAPLPYEMAPNTAGWAGTILTGSIPVKRPKSCPLDLNDCDPRRYSTLSLLSQQYRKRSQEDGLVKKEIRSNH